MSQVQRSRYRAPLPVEKVINFNDGVCSWQLVISRGQVFCRLRAGMRLVRVGDEYLQRQWLFSPALGWRVAETPTRMARLFYHLATCILPHWEIHVHPNYSRAERKGWSHIGATANGDLGNRCYKLVVELAQLMRVAVGCDRLYQIDQLNYESAGDVLEAIMGLQAMGVDWDPSHIVSETSIFVYRLWNTPQLSNEWNLNAVADRMFRAMYLNSILEELRHKSYVAKVALRESILLSIGPAVGFRMAAYVYSFL